MTNWIFHCMILGCSDSWEIDVVLWLALSSVLVYRLGVYKCVYFWALACIVPKNNRPAYQVDICVHPCVSVIEEWSADDLKLRAIKRQLTNMLLVSRDRSVCMHYVQELIGSANLCFLLVIMWLCNDVTRFLHVTVTRVCR